MKEHLLDALSKEIFKTDELIDRIHEELAEAPQGKLKIYKHSSGYQYYQSLPGQRNYISKKKPELAEKLAQKEYDTALLEQTQKLRSQMDALQHSLGELSPEDLLNTFSEEKQKLIHSFFLSDEEFIEEWLSMPYTGKGFSDSAPELFSNRGERVRSKSEKIIADKLLEMGIPYRYEAPLKLGSMGIVYPDFTMLKIRTREIIYWEHLGMMDDPDYSHKALNKVNQFIRNGYIPGKNLLLTFESKNIPINMRNVEIQLRAILEL